MEQGSKEWLAARAGKVTASRIADVMATLKSGGEAASRKDYRAQLVAERLSGTPAESFTNSAMQWGTDTEPFARAAYELFTEQMVEEVGIVYHHDIPMSGASPDGMVGKHGLIEIKCPNTATHIEYILSGKAPTKYHLQMLWQMECTGRDWCDFVTFDPRMPPEMQLFIVRFNRDQERIDAIKAEVVKFLGEVDEAIASLCKIFHKE